VGDVTAGFLPAKLRDDFAPLALPDPPAFLDNACMTLKPRPVVDAVRAWYEETPVCGGRGVYDLSHEVARRVEAGRAALSRLVGAPSPGSVVWTKNCTEAINLVAHAFPFEKGDVVLTSDREHNSNLVPWQVAARRRGIRHEVLPSGPDGSFDLDALDRRLAAGDVRLVSVVHASNLDGATLPVNRIARLARAAGARTLVDGAQAAGHMRVDVEAMGADFYALSVHKMYGPTGVGALVAREEALASLDAFMTGGDTVAGVTYEGHRLLDGAGRFEAGLQNYASLVAVEPTVRYLESIGLEAIERHERAFTARVARALRDIEGVATLGERDPAKRGGVTAFGVAGLDPDEVAILLADRHGVLVRSGDHCAHAWFAARGVDGSVRASAGLYNGADDADRLVAAVAEAAAKGAEVAKGRA